MPRDRRRQMVGGGGGAPFAPSSLSAVVAWLRVIQATSDVNGISSVPDVLNTNPAVQSVTARKPMPEASAGNGLPCMRFATNDVLVWPITPESSASNYAGWAAWVKPDALATTQRIIRVSTGTNGASTNKLTLGTSLATLSNIAQSGPSVTRGGGTMTTGWAFVTVEYNKDGADDSAKLTCTLDGVSVGTLAGTTLTGPLAAATGNILIGNANDGVASQPLNGIIGPNIYAFGSKMAGATVGLLTTAARTALMNFEAPT
jgi:hypothetical protein